MLKRIFDLYFASIMIVLLAPIYILVSLIIYFDDPGPVIFKQRRMGRYNQEFVMYKFRSMKLNTPNVATHLLENPDMYITKIGKIIRKTSIDELPQLFNVLLGDMSFVGPRPALYNQHDLNEMRTKANVQSVRPGITGWAQINGRDELPNETKVKLDEEYVKRGNLLFDMNILFRTLFAVLRSDGVKEGAN